RTSPARRRPAHRGGLLRGGRRPRLPAEGHAGGGSGCAGRVDAADGRDRGVIVTFMGGSDERETRGVPDLSVVVPVYNEEENLRPLHEQLLSALDGLGRSYEIIYVDDGSTDRSPVILSEVAQGSEAVRC